MADMDKFIAIGDIHGCIKSIEALLDKLRDFYDRRFIFVGDYIDRGPNSKSVVDLMLDFKEDVDCIFLRGNHEQMLLDALYKSDTNLWMANGGRSTLNSYNLKDPPLFFPNSHRRFYDNTTFYYDTDDYFFVHAGISPAKTIAESMADEEVEEFLWERSHLHAFHTPWEKTVVFGHTPRPQPLIKKNMIGIDTGCVYERRGYGILTAVKLPEEEFVQQNCLDD